MSIGISTKVYFICNGCGVEYLENCFPVNSEIIPSEATYIARDGNGDVIKIKYTGFFCTQECKQKYLEKRIKEIENEGNHGRPELLSPFE